MYSFLQRSKCISFIICNFLIPFWPFFFFIKKKLELVARSVDKQTFGSNHQLGRALLGLWLYMYPHIVINQVLLTRSIHYIMYIYIYIYIKCICMYRSGNFKNVICNLVDIIFHHMYVHMTSQTNHSAKLYTSTRTYDMSVQLNGYSVLLYSVYSSRHLIKSIPTKSRQFHANPIFLSIEILYGYVCKYMYMYITIEVVHFPKRIQSR